MITISAVEFKKAINRVIPCASKDDARPALCGVFFHHYRNTLRLVSADGFRIAVAEFETDQPVDELHAGMLVSMDTMKAIAKSKTSKGQMISIDMVKHEIDGKAVSLVEATFPDYNQIIPRMAKYTYELPADFTAAAAHMNSFAKSAQLPYNPIHWSITSSGHVLASKSEEIGSTRWDIPCNVTNVPPFVAGINAKFLYEMTKSADGEAITVTMNAHNAPFLFKFANIQYIIMPLFLESPTQLQAGDGTDAYGEKREYSDPTPFIWQPSGWNFDEQKQDPFPYEMDPRGLETSPADDAVQCDRIQVVKVQNQTDNWGKIHPEWGAIFAMVFCNPQPINQSAPDQVRTSKSELMTAMNKERARIRREYKNLPATCANELRRLYRAFGNLQRKNWKESTEHAPASDTGSLDWITLTTTRKLFQSILTAHKDTQAINVTDEFKTIKKEYSHV